MSFEAEVIPLFIGGVIAVSAIEFFLGWRSLRHRKDLRGLFAGHVVAMLLGFFFLIRSLFANWLGLSGYCLHFQLCEYRPFRPLLGCQRPLRGSDAFPLGGCTKILIIPVCGSGYPVNTCVSCHNARPVRSSCAVFGGSAALQTRRTACG